MVSFHVVSLYYTKVSILEMVNIIEDKLKDDELGYRVIATFSEGCLNLLCL